MVNAFFYFLPAAKRLNTVPHLQERYINAWLKRVSGTPKLFEVLTTFDQRKHVAKKSARIVDACCWQKIWALLDIYSFSTANLYRSVLIYLQRYFRKSFTLKDCTRLSTLVSQAYIESKVARCLAYISCQNYGDALEKLAVASSRYAMIHGQGSVGGRPGYPGLSRCYKRDYGPGG